MDRTPTFLIVLYKKAPVAYFRFQYCL